MRMIPKGYGKPLTPEQVTAYEEAGRKQREDAAKGPVSLGQRVGLPRDAAEYILKLEARIESLEQKVATLEGPAHLKKIEKR